MSKKFEKSVRHICGKAKKCSTWNKKVTKKPVAKKITERIELPRPPIKKSDVVISVCGTDPYKKFALALCIAIHEFKKILDINKPITIKKDK